MFYKTLNRSMIYAAIFVMAIIGVGLSARAADAQSWVPQTSISAVTRNQTVTIVGWNFPANQTYTVRMGMYGSQGVNGAVSGTPVNTGNGSFTVTVAIPAAVQNMSRIAIRLENGSAYFNYNWFWNNTTNPPAPTAGIVGLDERPEDTSPKPAVDVVNPTIGIQQVAGEVVTFRIYDFPANQNFNVYMGSRASGGYSDFVGTINSGNGDDRDINVTIPARISHYGYFWLRLDSGQYSPYVGFFNQTEPVAADTRGPGISSSGGSSSTVAAAAVPVWHGTPTITMCAVVSGSQVTFVTNNLTTNLDYTVRMNAMGTQGYNGYVVGTVSPGNDPSVRVSMPIPPQLAGHRQIAIRMDAPGGYNAYNWFWNNSATVC